MLEIKNNELLFARKNDSVIIPSKNLENGGYDIYANFEKDYMKIYPHETVMIPTGLYSAFSEDYVMILKERGSTGSKGIAQRCGVVDSGYRNEIFVPLTNTTNQNVIIAKDTEKYRNDRKSYEVLNIIYPYSKAICQAIMVEVPKLEVKEISLEELQSIPSKRGWGNLGSSGK